MSALEGEGIPASHLAEEVHLPSNRNSADYELQPIRKDELVHAASDIVKDRKTGKHYRRVKKPNYSVARNKGAARIDHSNYRGAPIGLGHTLPTTYSHGNRGSIEHSHEERQAIAREQAMFDRMRIMMREEFQKANKGHSDQIKQHLEDVIEKNAGEEGSSDTFTDRRMKTKTKSSDDSSLMDPKEAARGDSSLDEDDQEFPNPWAKIRYHCREPFAEFLACFVLLTFGDGINVQVQLSQLYDPTMPKGDYLSISFGWGIAVMAAVYVAGGISGGHINPGITLALACFRGFPWRKVPIYMAAQLAGGIMGALCIYGLYAVPIRIVDPDQTRVTAQLFCTFPAVSLYHLCVCNIDAHCLY